MCTLPCTGVRTLIDNQSCYISNVFYCSFYVTFFSTQVLLEVNKQPSHGEEPCSGDYIGCHATTVCTNKNGVPNKAILQSILRALREVTTKLQKSDELVHFPGLLCLQFLIACSMQKRPGNKARDNNYGDGILP